MELENRTAVVTGGASGIGAAVVQRLSALGAHPVVWDVADGADIHCDVADPESIEQAIAATIERYGPPTILAACAGMGHSGMLVDVEPGAWDRVLDVNVRGVWLTARACVPSMREMGGGSIVAITSVNSQLADANMGAYCVSKAGLEMLVRVASTEWAADGIRVNGVGPGVTKTPMLGRAPDAGVFDGVVERTPLGRLGEAYEVADAVVAVLQLDWVTGQNLMADGGLINYSPVDMVGAARRRTATS